MCVGLSWKGGFLSTSTDAWCLGRLQTFSRLHNIFTVFFCSYAVLILEETIRPTSPPTSVEPRIYLLLWRTFEASQSFLGRWRSVSNSSCTRCPNLPTLKFDEICRQTEIRPYSIWYQEALMHLRMLTTHAPGSRTWTKLAVRPLHDCANCLMLDWKVDTGVDKFSSIHSHCAKKMLDAFPESFSSSTSHNWSCKSFRANISVLQCVGAAS